MKNTTFRKKALLSSVAMLLVALVALGSATFAWFTANPTVTATGLQVTSSAADGLKIAKTDINTSATDAPTDDKYAQTVSIALPSAQVWGPVSPIISGTNATFYSGSAAAYNNYALKDPATSAANGNWYATDLWLKAASANGLSVSATITGTAANYARVALIDTAGNVTYLSATDETWNILGTDGTESSTQKTATASGTLTYDKIVTGQQFHVYVWFEGQDEDCIDINASKTLAVDLTFNKTNQS